MPGTKLLKSSCNPTEKLALPQIEGLQPQPTGSYAYVVASVWGVMFNLTTYCIHRMMTMIVYRVYLVNVARFCGSCEALINY